MVFAWAVCNGTVGRMRYEPMPAARTILALPLAILVAGCAPATMGSRDASPSLSQATPEATLSSDPSSEPSPEPSRATASASPAAARSGFQVWQNFALATVRVNGLNVRAAAGPSEALVVDEGGWFQAGDVVRLDAGDHVLVMGVTEGSDGLQWVQIGAQADPRQSAVAVGWAVAGTTDDPWVEEDNSWCPGAEPSFETLASLTGVERMGCYSSIPLTFTARQATIKPDAGLGGACGPAPLPWLQCDHVNYNWVNRDGGYDWEFLLHFNPATGIAQTGLADAGESKPLTITGHFNDQAAVSCAPDPPATNEDVAAYLRCSTLFVVESLD